MTGAEPLRLSALCNENNTGFQKGTAKKFKPPTHSLCGPSIDVMINVMPTLKPNLNLSNQKVNF